MNFVEEHPISAGLQNPVRRAIRGEAVEWPATLTAADAAALSAHGVVPLLFRATSRPELRDEALRAAALEPFRIRELRRVLEAIGAEGVDVLVLKGAALGALVYESSELRPRGDTDLLIRRADLPTVRATLIRLGYSEIAAPGDEHGLKQAIFVRQSGSLREAIDVHWRVSNTSLFGALLDFDEVWPRAIDVPEIGGRTLSFADSLLLACIHRVAHHQDSDRLIWLVDIALLRRRMTRAEHELFWRRADAARALTACTRSIALAEELMGEAPHDRAEEWISSARLAEKERAALLLDRDLRYGERLIAEIRSLPVRARFRRLRQLAFPSGAFLRAQAGERGGPLPLLYVKRAVRSARRLFRRAASPLR